MAGAGGEKGWKVVARRVSPRQLRREGRGGGRGLDIVYAALKNLQY